MDLQSQGIINNSHFDTTDNNLGHAGDKISKLTSDFPLTRHSSRSESLGRQTILWKKKEGKDGIGKISFVMSVVGHAGQAPGRPDRPAMDLAMALKC